MTEIIQQYKEWLRKHEPEIADSASKKLDKTIAELSRYLRASGKRAAVGVYGQSQGGKSFLVDSLLSNEGSTLTIKGLEVAFNEIIPEVKAESTAVTCRFTSYFDQTIPDGFFKCELLSLGELFFIFLAGFDEFEHDDTYENFVALQLDGFTLNESNTNIGRPDVYDMIYYISNENINKNKDAFPIIREKLYGILEKSLTTGLSFHDFRTLSKIIFGSVQNYSDFVLEVINLYEFLDYSQKILLPAALVRKFINTNHILKWNNKKSITIGFKQTSTGYQVTENGTYNLALLQIACAELILPIENVEHDYLKKIDILDFPGLRPFQQGEETNQTEQGIAKVIKQGKLKATFDLYSKRKEIPALIIASPWENAAADSLPKKIVSWLDEYCNPDYATTANRLLFFVMTKSDYMLSDNWHDNITERLEARLRAHYEIEFNPMLKKFGEIPYRNHYFTINPRFSQISLDNQSIAFARKIFIENDLVKKHLGGRVDDLFETFIDAEAGVNRLVNAINLLADNLNIVKQKIVSDSIKNHLLGILKDIDTFIHDENEIIERENNKQKLIDFTIAISDREVRKEFIPYVNKCYPDNWEWVDAVNNDVPLYSSDIHLSGDLGIDIDKLLEIVDEAGYVNHLSVLLDKFEKILLDQFTSVELPAIHQKQVENFIIQYLQACFVYFRKNESFRSIIEDFASIRASIDADDAVPSTQFREAIRNCLISNITGFIYHAEIKEPIIQRKVAKGLHKAAGTFFSTIAGFDPDANEQLKLIRNQIQTHV